MRPYLIIKNIMGIVWKIIKKLFGNNNTENEKIIKLEYEINNKHKEIGEELKKLGLYDNYMHQRYILFRDLL